jgi:small conductance mechanosensitive channel
MTWPILDALPGWLASAGRVLFILAAAYGGTRAARRLVRTATTSALAVMQRHAGGPASELEKRARTIIGIAHRTLVTMLWSVATVMALEELGFDITPILAGAGVVGLAVGFGAQNLVRDVISGFFLLIENQIRVNDVAIINGTGGLVEEINLRTTVLRSADGVVHVFPNGGITTLSNMTREYSYYVLDVGVAYKEDTDRVAQVLREIVEGMRAEEQYANLILEPLEVQGVDRFTDSAVIVKARVKTQPIRQWMVGREVNRRIKKRFDELGIEIPFPQRTLHVASDGDPVRLRSATLDRALIEQVVRDVVEELGLRVERHRRDTSPGGTSRDTESGHAS